MDPWGKKTKNQNPVARTFSCPSDHPELASRQLHKEGELGQSLEDPLHGEDTAESRETEAAHRAELQEVDSTRARTLELRRAAHPKSSGCADPEADREPW